MANGTYPVPYTAKKLAAAMWDAREARDPSGERIGCTMDDQTRRPIFWEEAVRENLWPGSREDAIREAALAIEIAESMPDD